MTREEAEAKVSEFHKAHAMFLEEGTIEAGEAMDLARENLIAALAPAPQPSGITQEEADKMFADFNAKHLLKPGETREPKFPGNVIVVDQWRYVYAPEPSADDVALVDALAHANRCMGYATSGGERAHHKSAADHARTALLARFDAIRREAIEECAQVVFAEDGVVRNLPERYQSEIRALKGK